jgi:hypothetical protein
VPHTGIQQTGAMYMILTLDICALLHESESSCADQMAGWIKLYRPHLLRMC